MVHRRVYLRESKETSWGDCLGSVASGQELCRRKDHLHHYSLHNTQHLLYTQYTHSVHKHFSKNTYIFNILQYSSSKKFNLHNNLEFRSTCTSHGFQCVCTTNHVFCNIVLTNEHISTTITTSSSLPCWPALSAHTMYYLSHHCCSISECHSKLDPLLSSVHCVIQIKFKFQSAQSVVCFKWWCSSSQLSVACVQAIKYRD